MKQREKAAAWLESIIAGIEKKIQEEGNEFYMGKYVSVYDSVHKCGTTCCIEGWLPSLYPKQLYLHPHFDNEPANPNYDVRLYASSGRLPEKFKPRLIGIPITDGLWHYLTLPGTGHSHKELISKYGAIYSDVLFEQMKIKILKIAADIREGELDEYLEMN